MKSDYILIKNSLYFLCELYILNVNFQTLFEIDTKVAKKTLESLALNTCMGNILEKIFPKFFFAWPHFKKMTLKSAKISNNGY